MSNEACLTHLLKYVENTRNSEQASYIVLKLQRMLDCSPDNIISRIEEYNLFTFSKLNYLD